MMASSFVVSTRSISATVDRVIEDSSPPRISAVDGGLNATSLLSDLGEQVRASMPLPIPDEASDELIDDTVAGIIRAMYSNRVVRATENDDAVERAVDAGRLHRAGEFTFVPLGMDGEYGHNWPLVFRFLVDRLGELSDRAQRVVARLDRSDAVSSATRRTWETVIEMIADIREILRFSISRQAKFSHVVRRPETGPEQFGRWVIGKSTGNQL